MKTILGLDVGYGFIKSTLYQEDYTVIKQIKVPSKIGITKKNEHISDSRIYDYKGHSYCVGENASHLPSENLINITEYANLEYYAPVFAYHILKLLDVKPDVIVTGLSIAQITNSGYFKEALQKFEVNGEEFVFDKVYILPQGAGCVSTIKQYGDNFPNKSDIFLGDSTFVLVDIGFSTIDMALVTKGVTSPNLFEGIEKEGVMKIASKIANKVKEQHQRSITLSEAKDILDSGVYQLRGTKYPFKDYIDEVKSEYIKDLLSLIESRYKGALDKCDFIFLCGGGSAFFKTTENGYIRVPKTAHEYYNSIGFGLFGLQQLSK